MNLISLTDAGKDSLPWTAFWRSDVPYFALRLKKTKTQLYKYNIATFK